MSRGQVAILFGVNVGTVDRWAKDGRFGDAVAETPGGQFRYKRAEITQLAQSMGFTSSGQARPATS